MGGKCHLVLEKVENEAGGAEALVGAGVVGVLKVVGLPPAVSVQNAG
jgi:hypothetical protein